jgi:hypothetical protein
MLPYLVLTSQLQKRFESLLGYTERILAAEAVIERFRVASNRGFHAWVFESPDKGLVSSNIAQITCCIFLSAWISTRGHGYIQHAPGTLSGGG